MVSLQIIFPLSQPAADLADLQHLVFTLMQHLVFTLTIVVML